MQPTRGWYGGAVSARAAVGTDAGNLGAFFRGKVHRASRTRFKSWRIGAPAREGRRGKPAPARKVANRSGRPEAGLVGAPFAIGSEEVAIVLVTSARRGRGKGRRPGVRPWPSESEMLRASAIGSPAKRLGGLRCRGAEVVRACMISRAASKESERTTTRLGGWTPQTRGKQGGEERATIVQAGYRLRGRLRRTCR